MAKQLILDITDGEAGGDPETRFFPGSPITIGAGVSNTLRLDDPRVARRHGLLFFTGSRVKYMDCSPGARALRRPDIRCLVQGVPIRIGPFHLSPRLEDRWEAIVPPTETRTGLALLTDEMDVVFRAVALTACAVSCDNPAAKLDIVARAMQFLDIVALLAAEIRRSDFGFWTSSDLGPPVEELCDPLLVTDFLLDPEGSALSLEDFRRRFVSLARWEALVTSVVRAGASS